MFIVYETYKKDEPEKNYIGKTTLKRYNKGYIGSGKLLKRAIKKYGKGKFKCIILHKCDDEKQQLELEKKLINERKTYYNLAAGGKGGDVTRFMDKTQKEKWRKNYEIGLKNRKVNLNEDARNRMGQPKGKDHFMYGKSHSDESKRKMRLKAKKGCESHHWNGITTQEMIDAYLESGSLAGAARKLGIKNYTTIKKRFKTENFQRPLFKCLMNHFIIKCKKCLGVITQCRCPSKDKKIEWINECEKCKENNGR